MSSKNNNSLHSKLINSNVMCSEIFVAPDIPEKKLNKALKKYGQGIDKSEIIALLDDTVFGSATEGILLTETHILFHELMGDPEKFDFSAITSLNFQDKKLIINGDNEFSACIDLGKITKLYEVLKSHIEEISFKEADGIKDNACILPEPIEVVNNNGIEQLVNDNIENIVQENAPTISNKFFGLIAKFDGYSIIIVSFLRNNAPDRVLSIISKLPVVGFMGMASRFVLAPALKWLNEQIINHGESYIMENLIDNFKKRNLTHDFLLEKIENAPKSVIGEEIIEDSIELLNKYMPSESISIIEEEENQLYSNDENENLICPSCGTENKLGAKFCCECGHKFIMEYKCKNCGYIHSTPIKFCPECGERFAE